ncbi:MAG TPA: hypothetical protein PLI90_00430 [Rhodocyclaceae bacterium]|nr:hypothetical protein [Rhodocyclaceae bacterium]
MPRNNRNARSSRHLDAMRRDIASHAARLMAEDGIADFGLAKRKAARQLGASDSEALPNNQEVEEALRTYQSIYQEDELRERLIVLRREALDWMRELQMFNPYLTGPTLDGSAGRYAEVEIDLFADSGKDVEIFLLNKGIVFKHVDFRHAGPDLPELRLRVEGRDATLLLSVYPQALERIHRRNPHTGQVPGRAGIETVAALLESP